MSYRVAQKLSAAIAESGLTQAAVANACQVARSTINRIEAQAADTRIARRVIVLTAREINT